MASLMDTLMDVLSEEEVIYRDLIKLSEEKTPAIIAGNIEKLNEIVEKEQPFIERITSLEKKREEVSNDIAVVLNMDVKTLNIKSMIKMLKGQPNEQKKLSEIHDRLSSTVKVMAAINGNNRALLEQSLEMVEFEMNLFQSMRKAPETANYGKDAYNTGDLLINTSGFDAKQ